MPNPNVVGMLQNMAQNGTAPSEGCSLFSVGYEDAFERLRNTYLTERFQRGDSAEKFIIGPYGAGKTHFLRRVIEMARDLGCVTAEVALTKDLDFTQNMVTYREVARELRAPNGTQSGIRALMTDMIEWVKSKAPDPEQADALANAWASGLDQTDFKLEAFGRIAKKGMLAHLARDDAGFTSACRWLGGEVTDKALCKEIGASPVVRSEEGLHGRRALLSLLQLVRYAGYSGTVVGFDEAEQGLSADKKKMQRILSMLQSGINAMNDLADGSALIIFALTPDIAEKMDGFPALQQRVSNPVPGTGFLDGDTYAPKIDLTVGRDDSHELQAIGDRLVDLLYEHAPRPLTVPIEEARTAVREAAEDVLANEVESGNRRTLVKRACSILLGIYDGRPVEGQGGPGDPTQREPEV